MTRLAGMLLIISLLAPSSVLAASSFQALPPLGFRATALQIRVLRYTGGVHGKMIVEVRNRGTEQETFSSKGLYFVPQVAPERAPQREGAAGPFEVASFRSRQRAGTLALMPRQTVRLELRTFCLDSHRRSPLRGQAYRVASRRLPAALQTRIESGVTSILAQEGGGEGNLEAIQQLVWTTRNRGWIPLEGERRDERAGPASAPAAPAAPVESAPINL